MHVLASQIVNNGKCQPFKCAHNLIFACDGSKSELGSQQRLTTYRARLLCEYPSALFCHMLTYLSHAYDYILLLCVYSAGVYIFLLSSSSALLLLLFQLLSTHFTPLNMAIQVELNQHSHTYTQFTQFEAACSYFVLNPVCNSNELVITSVDL